MPREPPGSAGSRTLQPQTQPRPRLLPSTQTALLSMIADAAPHRFTPPADALVVSDARASAEERVQVYAYMYRARIAEALASQFPRLARLLGAEAFEALAFGYVTDHPSRHPSLRVLGTALPEWLERKHGSLGLSDLARLEWARTDVFDAVDEPSLTVDALRAWPLDAFMQLPVKLVAAHRLVTVDFAIGAFWDRIGEAPETPEAPEESEASPTSRGSEEEDGSGGCTHAADAPPIKASLEDPDSPAGETLLVWRQGAAVYHRVIDAPEREALELAVAGTTFGAICETLPSWRTTEEVSGQAFTWLWSWTTAELLLTGAAAT